MSEVLIFGGTTEGRMLAEFCDIKMIPAAVSVTTEYGAGLLPQSEYIRELVGNLDTEKIINLISTGDFSVVIDATHPFARNASANIKNACAAVGMRCIRLLREPAEIRGKVFNSIQEIVEYLNENNKRVLVTTGGNSVAEYTKVNDFAKRLTVRLLPADGVAERCKSLGYLPHNLIFEKGPFTVEQNIEHIRRSGAEILVTKESGAAGGFPEKAEAAEYCSIQLVTLRRPAEEGYSLAQVESYLETEFV